MSGNFWTDLARHLTEYERGEREDEHMRETYGDDWRELATDPEARDLISEGDVLDHHDTKESAA